MMKGKKPNNRRLLLFSILAVLIAFGSICTIVSAAETTSEASTEAQVAITNVSLDPAIFMQDDQGTLTVRIANSGTSPVAIDRVELLSEEFKVVNYQTYDKVGTLGEGNSLSFTFVLEADGKDGLHQKTRLLAASPLVAFPQLQEASPRLKLLLISMLTEFCMLTQKTWELANSSRFLSRSQVG